MKRAAVIGWPLRHSLSPVFQQAALDELGIPVKFEVWETPPERKTELRQKLLAKDCLGACVTLPYKRYLISEVDHLDTTARRIGALNWIFNRDGQLWATNTHAAGVRRALEADLDFKPRGKRAFVFGTGGAAQAVVRAIIDGGATETVVASHTPDNAQLLVAQTDSGACKLSWAPSFAESAGGFDLLVNASVAGMSGGPAPDWTPVAPELVPSHACGYDLVYNPRQTPFMRAVRQGGGRVAGGLSMLIWQGVLGFELLTGRKPRVETMFAAVSEP